MTEWAAIYLWGTFCFLLGWLACVVMTRRTR